MTGYRANPRLSPNCSFPEHSLLMEYYLWFYLLRVLISVKVNLCKYGSILYEQILTSVMPKYIILKYIV
jgi:hypothetical protein